MRAYACYRLPGHTSFVRVVGSPVEIDAYSHLGNQSGFVMAPFAISPQTPLLIITPESISSHQVGAADETGHQAPGVNAADNADHADHGQPSPHSADRMRYARDFKTFHDKLADGTFRKIVLARTAEDTVNASPEALFLTACRLYPNLFVAMVCAPQCGTWITATPEILIEQLSCSHATDINPDCYHTMALAGTMTKGNHWNSKNIEEQGYVADYITECISSIANHISISGPHTVSAGDIVHLRTDFSFSLNDGLTIGDIIGNLHPTPAVCGMPKQTAMAFIEKHESQPRLYYSGFMGPLHLCGQTRLYVSLRCMNIRANKCQLYAGGGLLKESIEQDEWCETEAKMMTMRRCLRTCNPTNHDKVSSIL